MKTREPPWDWRFPERGMTKEEVRGKVLEFLDEAKNCGYPVLGSLATPKLSFPGCRPHEVAVEAYQAFVPLNLNNILLHANGSCDGKPTGEPQFSVTTDREREVMSMLIDLCGGTFATVAGYITSGGTEGNCFGMVMAREYLRRGGNMRDSSIEGIPIAAVGSYELHYSLLKGLFHCGISPFGEISYRPDGSGFHAVDVSPAGDVDAEQLEAKIRELYVRGIRHFVILLTAGTCIGGGVDKIDEIASKDGLLAKLERDYFNDPPHFFVHVDAAFGGYVLPFLEKPIKFGFEFSYVQTITLDPHKMGLMMYDCGVFLCRQELLSLVSHEVGYVPSPDQTMRGSRSAAIPIALWAVTKHLGREGYEQNVRKCRRCALRAQGLLATIPGVLVVPSPMNFASFSIDRDKPDPADQDPFVDAFALRFEEVPKEFRDGNSGRHRLLIKIPIMPHTTDEHIDAFVTALREWLVLKK